MLLKIYVKSPLIWVFNLLLFVTVDKAKKQYLLLFKEIIGLLVLFLMSYFLAFIPMGLALGENFVPDRIQSLILMYLIFGFGYLLVWIKFKVGQWNPLSLATSQILLLVLFLSLLFLNSNSKHFYDELEFIELEGLNFKCPRHLDQYLQFRYGVDFMEEKPNFSPDKNYLLPSSPHLQGGV
jgi:energy-coupling factor transporter transmembrane protein EcfT